MLVLLPPSETKRDGGTGLPLDWPSLSFPRLTAARREASTRLIEVCRDENGARAALKLGPQGAADIARNRVLASAPTMPAIERYTGVLYDALDAAHLDDASRRRGSAQVVIHSALFGLIRADDPIPAYRLSHNSRLPAVSLPALWKSPISRELADQQGLILDLRSEGYAKLGPLPVRDDAAAVRVVSRDANGQRRAISHTNKAVKGAFARDILRLPVPPTSVAELVVAAGRMGWMVEAAEHDPSRRSGPARVLTLLDTRSRRPSFSPSSSEF